MELYEALDEVVISTRFLKEGAFNTQSSKESFVQIFLNNVHFTEDDVLVDVGCGVGRVLSMLHDYCRLRIIGVEIDPIIAEIARDRVKGMDNVKVVTGNILDCEQEIKDATIFYLFNPFNSDVLDKFLALVERIGRNDVRIIYLKDIFNQILEQHHWEQVFRKPIGSQDKPGSGLSIWKRSSCG